MASKTNHSRLFGSVEDSADTCTKMIECCHSWDCLPSICPLYDICSYGVSKKMVSAWLKRRGKKK